MITAIMSGLSLAKPLREVGYSSVLLTNSSGNTEVTLELPSGCDNENETSKSYTA